MEEKVEKDCNKTKIYMAKTRDNKPCKKKVIYYYFIQLI